MRVYYIAGAAAVAGLAAAAFFSIERARADFAFRTATPGSVARAVAMQPGNTEYLALDALQTEYDGGDPRPLLERAAKLNPYSSAPRIRLGLDAEVRGDNAAAERWLLEAARIDHQYETRWTLANFYFRRGNADEFWKWMREALQISYGDRRPAFELCWQMSGDANEIFTRAIPARREVVAAYLGWLLETRRTQAIAPVAMNLASDPENRALVLAAGDALLGAADAPDAIALWKAMGFAAPRGIYRGNFEHGATGHGFDWRWTDITGVTHFEIDEPRTMHRISFDGREPESCELLRQTLVLKRGERYRLSWNSSASEMPSPSGIEWQIGETHRAAEAQDLDFVAPGDLADLRLVYQRPSGEARAEGSIELWGLALVHLSR